MVMVGEQNWNCCVQQIPIKLIKLINKKRKVFSFFCCVDISKKPFKQKDIALE